MTYAELSASQAKRSVRFSEAQTEVMATYCDAEHDLKELQAENAKLRELARDMYGFIQSMDEDCGDVIFSDCFDYCKHEVADDGCRKIGKCWYDRRMHELGVEVDG